MKRKKERSFWKLGVIFLILFLIIDLYLIWDLGLLNISKLDITLDKVTCTGQEAVKSQTNILGKNFFLIKDADIQKKLIEKFLCIKSVTILKQFPNLVKLHVSGREPAAILAVTAIEASSSAEASGSALLNFSTSSNGSFLVDSEGVVYSEVTPNINVPKLFFSSSNIQLGQKLGENIKNTLNILDKLKALNIIVLQGKIYTPGILVLQASPKIIFSLNDSIDYQVASLQLILDKAKIEESELDYVDLRFNKPVVKYLPKKK